MLERLGFTSVQLATPVKDLSGGQRRRLQLLLILLDEPNVLILDEPTNDLDTDMLAAMEDLLDTWPGTLIVVSHDRYFLERVTDQQYAVIDGQFRHLPGGVDEYLRLSAAAQAASASRAATTISDDSVGSQPGSSSSGVVASQHSSAEIRAAKKELNRIERRLTKIEELEASLHTQMADNPTDYELTAKLDAQLRELADERDGLEMEWLDASEIAG
jgi:ABC-type multidrug transport system ATPase subunit